jgi:deoxyribodipyrimidine photo-lyase
MPNKNKVKNGLFIFRRDLRVTDNRALHLLSDLCENIYSIFVFTPEQVGSGNEYKSNNAVQFMVESLDFLDSEIRKQGGTLNIFYGSNAQAVKECIRELDIQMVAFNLDITPYARKRDAEIRALCEKQGVQVECCNDYYLHEPGSVLNGSGKTYVKFTPYYNAATRTKVLTPLSGHKYAFKGKQIGNSSLSRAKERFFKPNPNVLVHGGRENGLKQLHAASKHIRHYATSRNELSKPTSQLSAYIKFGCVSIREVYEAFRRNPAFLRQLYWRDFYANVLFAFPQVLSGHALNMKYDKIRWHYNDRWFQAWCNGKTGFPIVDAGMRQMNTTGYMHNRARLVTMSFLIKIMLIDWRKGERYFATKLVDYDPASNNGNTMWTMGGGADSMPWFRYFNPWRQTEEHDPQAEYVKQWIPELRDVPLDAIFKWETQWANYKHLGYEKPILNYSVQKDKSIQMYKAALNT